MFLNVCVCVFPWLADSLIVVDRFRMTKSTWQFQCSFENDKKNAKSVTAFCILAVNNVMNANGCKKKKVRRGEEREEDEESDDFRYKNIQIICTHIKWLSAKTSLVCTPNKPIDIPIQMKRHGTKSLIPKWKSIDIGNREMKVYRVSYVSYKRCQYKAFRAHCHFRFFFLLLLIEIELQHLERRVCCVGIISCNTNNYRR